MSTVLFTGGLGNQLFQYTFMLYLKECKGETVKYNLSSIPFYNIHSGFEADKIFDFSDFSEDKTNYFSVYYRGLRKISKKLFNKPLFYNYETTDTNKSPKIYEGFWMQNKYYLCVKETLKNNLKSLDDYCADVELKKKIETTESVFIHVRRGDYVGSKTYFDLSQTDYYKKSVDYIVENCKNPEFFVFSDDIDWCKNYFCEYPFFTYVKYENQSTLGDLSLMLACKYAITANSSFSRWGAAFDTKKIVIRPSHYFLNKNNDSMYPDDWIVI